MKNQDGHVLYVYQTTYQNILNYSNMSWQKRDDLINDSCWSKASNLFTLFEANYTIVLITRLKLPLWKRSRRKQVFKEKIYFFKVYPCYFWYNSFGDTIIESLDFNYVERVKILLYPIELFILLNIFSLASKENKLERFLISL